MAGRLRREEPFLWFVVRDARDKHGACKDRARDKVFSTKSSVTAQCLLELAHCSGGFSRSGPLAPQD